MGDQGLEGEPGRPGSIGVPGDPGIDGARGSQGMQGVSMCVSETLLDSSEYFQQVCYLQGLRSGQV